MINKIKEYIKSLYTEEYLTRLIDEIINSGDFIHDDWEDEHECMNDWYIDYGLGEVEDEILNDILEGIARHISEPIHDWYINNKYGDINELIYEFYPQLNHS